MPAPTPRKPHERMNLDPLGESFTRPVARLDDTLSAIRAVWSSGGGQVTLKRQHVARGQYRRLGVAPRDRVGAAFLLPGRPPRAPAAHPLRRIPGRLHRRGDRRDRRAPHAGYVTYNMVNTHDDRVSLDSFVDWLIDAGYPLQRIDDYDDWLSRLETALRGLPQVQRDRSLLPLMDAYRHPAPRWPAQSFPRTGSAPRYATRASDLTTTSRTRVHHSSSSTSPICNTSNCCNTTAPLRRPSP